eukprot:764987-Hanusia_phi.AAC.10
MGNVGVDQRNGVIGCPQRKDEISVLKRIVLGLYCVHAFGCLWTRDVDNFLRHYEKPTSPCWSGVLLEEVMMFVCVVKILLRWIRHTRLAVYSRLAAYFWTRNTFPCSPSRVTFLLPHRYEVDGNKLKVQHGKSQAGRRGDNRGGYDGGQGPRGPRPTGQNRVYVDGVDSKISWQDLKDFARKAGNPAFTEVMEDTKGKYGVIEYRTAEDCYSACRMLDGTMIGNCKVRVYEANGSSSGGGSKGGGYPRERSAGRSGGSDSISPLTAMLRYDDRGPRGDRRDYPPERYDRGPGDRYGDRYPPGGRSGELP